MLFYMLTQNTDNMLMINISSIVKTITSNKKVLQMFLIIETIVISLLLFVTRKTKNIYYSEQVELTPKIKVPKPIGQGQYGTGWWLNKKDYNKVFSCNVIDRTKEYNQVCLKSAGIVTHFEREGNLDKVYYINENLHTLLVGSTGSGKSRSVIIPTITMLGLAGENMCISDVKGELHLYTADDLKKLGYDVIAIDYINFLKSNKYNYLDIIINAVEQDNIPLAESLINDLVNILVEKNEKTEPIWKNGEMSVIKTAIYILLPDDRDTYHRLGSILVKQLYTSLVVQSRKTGGELKNRMNFILDEFANFTKIDSFQAMLTVARGRNIRFFLCLQSLLSQIEEKYGKEGAQSIIDNCMLIYLKTGNIETANKISERLGTYTAQSYGESSNSNNKYDKASSSMSLISRKLLTPDEVLMIENPYALVMVTGKPPAITTIPDISKMHFNKINGMGSKEHNQKLRIERENAREERPIKPIKIWNIWDKQTEEKMPRMKVEVIQDNFRKNLKGK